MRRNWSCSKCLDEYWNELEQRRSDTAASAATDTAASAASDGMSWIWRGILVELKAEVVQVKAEVEWLKAAFMELKYAGTKQTTDARPGSTIVVALTEEEAEEMRYIAKETGRRGESLVHLSSDIGGLCCPLHPEHIADSVEVAGNTIVTLSSRLLELLREQSRLRGELHGHYARVRERDEEILARAFLTAPDDAVPDDTRDAVDTAVRQEAEKTSHDG